MVPKEIRPKTLFVMVAMVAVVCMVQYLIIAYHLLKIYSIFRELEYKRLLESQMIDQIEFSLNILSILCVSYGATLLLIPVIVFFKRKWSMLGDLGFMVIVLSFVLASYMLIHGGMMLGKYLDTFHSQSAVAWHTYVEDPEKGIDLLLDAIDDLKNAVLIYIRLGLFFCFYAYIFAIWGVIVGEESGRKISIGFLLLGFGHLSLACPLPIVSWITILGYLYWIYGVWCFAR